MRKNTRNGTGRTQPKKNKYCALLDKPCIGNECAQHFDKFSRCSLELIPYNMYPLTVALQELTEINHDLLEALGGLVPVLEDKESDGQKELF